MATRIILEDENMKKVISKDYNSIYDKKTGMFARWGATKNEDPQMAPLPEIADIEISSGLCHNNCPFCYKANRKDGQLHNMTFEQFREIFHKIAKTVILTTFKSGKKPIKADMNISWKGCYTKKDIEVRVKNLYNEPDDIKEVRVYNEGLLQQIAFGITSPTDNPDFFRMMEYCREFDVVPNYTCNGRDMTAEIAQKTAKLCGACAISLSDKETSYNAVQLLHDAGLQQVNFHIVGFKESYKTIVDVLQSKDTRLEGLNALVILRYKPKGTNAGKFEALAYEDYKRIFDIALQSDKAIGFDSCSAPIFIDSISHREDKDKLAIMAEPCESTLFSVYVNSYCEVSPCSFCEHENRNGNNWEHGINLLDIYDFKDVWFDPRIVKFRENLLKNKRHCPMFNI